MASSGADGTSSATICCSLARISAPPFDSAADQGFEMGRAFSWVIDEQTVGDSLSPLAGIGWTWIDTNIPDGPPVGGCWWDPWWGYVCTTTYPTKTKSAFSYQATLGVLGNIEKPTL